MNLTPEKLAFVKAHMTECRNAIGPNRDRICARSPIAISIDKSLPDHDNLMPVCPDCIKRYCSSDINYFVPLADVVGIDID